jgi:hypothetical protein
MLKNANGQKINGEKLGHIRKKLYLCIVRSEEIVSEQDINTFRVMFTPANFLYHGVRYNRRKQLSRFIHELKKLSGRKYHKQVVEMLEECNEDYVFINVKSENVPDGLMDEVIALCDKFRIPRQNVCQWDEFIDIHLYTDI